MEENEPLRYEDVKDVKDVKDFKDVCMKVFKSGLEWISKKVWRRIHPLDIRMLRILRIFILKYLKLK